MPFLPSFHEDASLIDILKKFPDTSRPLIVYHEALLRGPSPFTVAQRELIAAYVSGLNACQYCHGVHGTTAEHFGIGEALVRQLLDDPDQAEIEPRMKPALAYVKKLTLTPSRVSASDAEAVFAAGWDERALHDAVSVCALFNFMNRFVEGMGLKGSPAYFKVAAERLAADGYASLLRMFNL